MTVQSLPPKAPNLPLAPVTYDAGFVSKLTNALRLYFNQQDQATADLLYGFKIYGDFYSTADQTNPVGGAQNVVTFDNTRAANGVTIDAFATSHAIVERTGTYVVSYSLQLDKTGAGATSVYSWLNVNGTAVTASARQTTLVDTDSEKSVSMTVQLALNAADYVQVAWSSADTGARLEYTAGSSPVPAIPSATLSVAFLAPALRAG